MKYLNDFRTNEGIVSFLKKKLDPNSFKKLLYRALQSDIISDYIESYKDGLEDNIVIVYLNKEKFHSSKSALAMEVIDTIEVIFNTSVRQSDPGPFLPENSNPKITSIQINLLDTLSGILGCGFSKVIYITPSRIPLDGIPSIWNNFKLIIKDIEEGIDDIQSNILASKVNDEERRKLRIINSKEEEKRVTNNDEYIKKMDEIILIKDDLSDYFIHLEELSTSFKINPSTTILKFEYNITGLNNEYLNINNKAIEIITNINTAKNRIESKYPNIDIKIKLSSQVIISMTPKNIKYISLKIHGMRKA